MPLEASKTELDPLELELQVDVDVVCLVLTLGQVLQKCSMYS